jgi:PAS domain S-box-containing protein
MTVPDDTGSDRTLRLLFLVEHPGDTCQLENSFDVSGIRLDANVVNSAKALDALPNTPLDCAVAYFFQADEKFLALLAHLRHRRPALPVVVVSGAIGEERVAELFRLGIADFVSDSKLARLPETVMNVLGQDRSTTPLPVERRLNLFEAVSRGSSNVVLAKDIQGRYLFANQAACEFIGRSENGILGRRACELFPEARAREIEAADAAVLDGNCSLTREETVLGANGLAYLHVIRGPIHASDGAVAGTFAIALDMTERRRLELIALAHARLLEMVADDVPLAQFFPELIATVEAMLPGMHAAVMLLDPDTQRLRFSASGLPSAIQWLDGLAIRDGVASCGTAAARRGQVLVADALTDPLWRDFAELARALPVRSAWSTPILTRAGELLGTLALYGSQPGLPGAFEQRVIEMATRIAGIAIVRRREEDLIRKLRLAVDQNPNSIVITNTEPAIEYVNLAFERMSGYSFAEVKARNPSILQSGLTPRATFDDLWRHLRQGRSWQGELINRRKNGEIFVEHGYFSPIRQADGSISHFLCIKEDITEKKRIAEELDAHRNRLEELVAERTEELSRARDAAEAAGRAKATFLANMSHEIRTPLNAIVGLAHMLRRRNPTPEQDGKLGKIVHSADHLLSVINDILDISKIDAGKLVLELKPFDLEESLKQISFMVIDKARAKGVEVLTDLGDVPRSLIGDATRLGQALLNYLGNAVKFTDSGRVVLRVLQTAETDNTVQLRFEVEDNGIGIEPALLQTLFQPFQQADDSITRQYGGTGLGLAISRNIAQLMNGEVGATSTPGAGSVFWLTAWFGKGRPASAQGGEHGMADLEGVRALVVEDVALTRMVLLQQLRMLGLRAEGVASGEEALDVMAAAEADDDPFGVLYLDMYLPGMDGLDTLSRAQALPLLRQPLPFLVTGACDEELQIEAGVAGVACILQKPVSTLALHDSLLNYFVATGRSAAPSRAVSVEATLRQRHAGSRILLVEDEPINQLVAREMLEDIGMVVDVANNGIEALERISRDIYRIVLMDVQMPKMGGLEATQRIRQLPGGERLPVVALTANAFNDDRELCYASGMSDFLPKPVVPEQLFAILFKWLEAECPAEQGVSIPQ